MTVEQAGMSFLNKPLRKANIKDISSMLNVASVVSEKIITGLEARGVDCAVSPIALKALDSDVFTKSGDLTKAAKLRIGKFAKSFGFSNDMTIGDAINIIAKQTSKQEVPSQDVFRPVVSDISGMIPPSLLPR